MTTGHLLCGLGVADQEWPLVLAAGSLKKACTAFKTIANTLFATACVHMQRDMQRSTYVLSLCKAGRIEG